MSMKYDFTTILNREGTGAIAVSKIPFDNAEIKEGFSKSPMWVADMNYATAPSVIEAIQKTHRQAHHFHSQQLPLEYLLHHFQFSATL